MTLCKCGCGGSPKLPNSIYLPGHNPSTMKKDRMKRLRGVCKIETTNIRCCSRKCILALMSMINTGSKRTEKTKKLMSVKAKGKVFTKEQRKNMSLSKEKYYQSNVHFYKDKKRPEMSRDKHPLWKNGKTYYIDVFRRKNVKVCALCRLTEEQILRKYKHKLNVHHMNRDVSDNRTENLLLLCHGCHTKIHITKGDKYSSFVQ